MLLLLKRHKNNNIQFYKTNTIKSIKLLLPTVDMNYYVSSVFCGSYSSDSERN